MSRRDRGGFADDIEAGILEHVRDQLRERFASIRHPETGEFPTVVVRGKDLNDLRLSIEGSPALLEIVSARMSDEERDATVLQSTTGNVPHAFLSYASEDRELAGTLARGLMARGIQTWWDEWEIGSGDSLRRKIDEGLGDCTHFIVLLTPHSLRKEWVQIEMDAALVRRVEGQAKFIPLRHEITPRELPPLLSGMRSPELDLATLDDNIRDLANDIHGLSRKPALGAAPSSASLPMTGYSPTATAIAKVFVETTRDAMFADPQRTVAQLAEAIEASEEDVEDAVHELRDFLQNSFNRILPEASLYANFDGYFMDWSPEADALRIAADLVNDPNIPGDAHGLAESYGWERRRMNPALAWLRERNLIRDDHILSGNYVVHWVRKNDATRRFVKSRS